MTERSLVYYNENDPFAAQWLRNMISTGRLPAGEVDERSIVDVRPDDIKPFRQCHFFAGIGGWPYALALAGWPEDRAVWTGSCPCQPLSSAGQRKGHADERHLWPAFYRLIAERQPATIFGEQVASAGGREWLAGVRADLERLGYAVGGADLPAAGVGAPHIRQRLFWVADAGHAERRALGRSEQDVGNGHDSGRAQAHRELGACSEVRGMADASASGWRALFRPERADGRQEIEPDGHSDAFGLGDAIGARLEERPSQRRDYEPQRSFAERAGGDAGGLGDAALVGWQQECAKPRGRAEGGRSQGSTERSRLDHWSRAEWIVCLDGKARRTQSSIFPLVDGLPAAVDGLGSIGRVGALRGAGNAIVPQVAAAFVTSFMMATE